MFNATSISHAGTGYRLLLNVTYPTTVKFSVEIGPITVKERVLAFSFQEKPVSDIYETMPILPAFNVSVYDTANGQLVDNTGWRGRQWLFTAELILPSGIV